MYYNSTKSINSTKGVFGSRHGAHIDVPKTSAGKMLAAKLAAFWAPKINCAVDKEPVLPNGGYIGTADFPAVNGQNLA
jgi:hypothetical protein